MICCLPVSHTGLPLNVGMLYSGSRHSQRSSPRLAPVTESGRSVAFPSVSEAVRLIICAGGERRVWRLHAGGVCRFAGRIRVEIPAFRCQAGQVACLVSRACLAVYQSWPIVQFVACLTIPSTTHLSAWPACACVRCWCAAAFLQPGFTTTSGRATTGKSQPWHCRYALLHVLSACMLVSRLVSP